MLTLLLDITPVFTATCSLLCVADVLGSMPRRPAWPNRSATGTDPVEPWAVPPTVVDPIAPE